MLPSVMFPFECFPHWTSNLLFKEWWRVSVCSLTKTCSVLKTWSPVSCLTCVEVVQTPDGFLTRIAVQGTSLAFSPTKLVWNLMYQRVQEHKKAPESDAVWWRWCEQINTTMDAQHILDQHLYGTERRTDFNYLLWHDKLQSFDFSQVKGAMD